jgi:hypothetical protein
MRLQGCLYSEWRSAPRLSDDCREVSMQELAHPSDWFCSRPPREVRGGPKNELGEVLGEPIRTRL